MQHANIVSGSGSQVYIIVSGTSTNYNLQFFSSIQHPVSYTHLEWGADIVFGTTQRLGIPMFYGGPSAGYFAIV